MNFIQGGVLVFDSGVGGLTVLQECLKQIPNEIFYYYGDNEHAPYGNLSQEKISELVYFAIEKHAFLNPKAVVLACNTATAVAVESLREKYPFPVIGVEPAVYLGARALEKQGGGKLLVLATRATCASERVRILKEKAELRFLGVEIVLHPCLELAGAIEKGIFCKNFCVERFLPSCKANGVVLGCTHYVYFKNEISSFYACPAFDGNDGVARRLKELLTAQMQGAGDRAYLKQALKQDLKQEKNSLVKSGGNFLIKNGEKYPLQDAKFDFLRDTQPLETTASFWGKNGKIFFLGASKSYNQRVFEQMFANVRK